MCNELVSISKSELQTLIFLCADLISACGPLCGISAMDGVIRRASALKLHLDEITDPAWFAKGES